MGAVQTAVAPRTEASTARTGATEANLDLRGQHADVLHQRCGFQPPILPVRIGPPGPWNPAHREARGQKSRGLSGLRRYTLEEVTPPVGAG